MLHLKTLKRDLIDRLHSLGLSISYDEVLRLSSDMANAVCEHFKETDTVCLPNLKTNVFTTAAVDNIDHNTSSTTAVSSFHGTSISLIQYPTVEGEGVENASFKQRNVSASKTIGPLPSSYTNIPPLSNQKQGGLRGPSMQCNVNGDDEALSLATVKEIEWLNHMRQHVEDHQQIDKEDMQPTVAKQAGNGKAPSKNRTAMVSWSAFHGERQKHVNARCQSSLLPLFAEAAHSIAMIQHAITVVMKAVEHLNPGQAAVIAFDQPLYALARQIQWRYPDTMGEDKLVVMLGGLHIELAVLKAIGSWLLGSGWTEAVAQGGITTTGRAESLVTSAHITRTRYVRQITASSLYILQQRAYKNYCAECAENAPPFPEWRKDQAGKIPQFQFWNMTLTFELLIRILVHSFRQSDFRQYTAALMAITPWIFALDRTNYSRWLPVHIRVMVELPNKHTHVYKEFSKGGKFTVQKTTNTFSSIRLDQAHEQNNELIKGDGGIIGITENPGALLRCMVAGPELARMVKDFETTVEEDNTTQTCTPDHEQSRAFQARFISHIQSLVLTIEELGNPLEEESTCTDLISLVSKDIAYSAMKATLNNIESIGKGQYEI